jgi:DNA-binding transcriptional ArsR family regulator
MEDFVRLEIAKKLKDKGFNYLCIGHYINNQLYIAHYQNAFHNDTNESIDAPTISQVLKWLREAKRIDSGAIWDNRDGKWAVYASEMDIPDLAGQYVLPNTHDTYEQAALAGIEYCLDNLI